MTCIWYEVEKHDLVFYCQLHFKFTNGRNSVTRTLNILDFLVFFPLITKKHFISLCMYTLLIDVVYLFCVHIASILGIFTFIGYLKKIHRN